MTYEEVRKNDSYIIKCRDNYFRGIRPSNSQSKSLKDYQVLESIAKAYLLNGYQKEFVDFFMEGQYLIDLWTAHFILEYGQPDLKLRPRVH